MNNENHSSGLLYFMPDWIFNHQKLSNTEKMLYALLSGLAHGTEEKTCFPSDEYLSKRLNVRKQQANLAVANLTKIGAISKKVVPNENNPFRKKRIITVFLHPPQNNNTQDNTEKNQKTFTCSQKQEHREESDPLNGVSKTNEKHKLKKCLRNSGKPELRVSGKPELELIKNISIYKKSTLKSTKKSAAQSGIERAAHVKTSQKDHEKLIQDFGEEKTLRAYKRLSEWKLDVPKSRWRKNDYLAIRRWVMDALLEDDLKKQKLQNLSAFAVESIKNQAWQPKNGWDVYNANQKKADKFFQTKIGKNYFTRHKTCITQSWGVCKESISFDLPSETFKQILQKWYDQKLNELLEEKESKKAAETKSNIKSLSNIAQKSPLNALHLNE